MWQRRNGVRGEVFTTCVAVCRPYCNVLCQVAEDGPEVGDQDKASSWDFSEPGAVSRLMSILQGQVTTLDQQLG